MSRQLAAIMFTDIVGYSTLMSDDEERAFELIRKNREVQRPLIEKYHGRWLKEIGDGVLASFSTVSDAVYCAGAIQKACENEPELNLRIGIHLGEVIFEGDDVFGDGVNIASRLEPLAPVGGILVSESVNSNLVNKKGIQSTFVSKKTLKNLKEPVKLYEIKVDPPAIADEPEQRVSTLVEKPVRPKPLKTFLIITAAIAVITIGLFLIFQGPKSASDMLNTDSGLPVKKSIAVLPFSDFSPEKDQEWFSDGLTEELLNCLARLAELQVTARTSSFAFKNKNLPIQLIADSLGVNYILEGSVRKAGNQLRVTAQLINPKQDAHIWSETYDRELKDVFTIQEDIANNIAASLDVYLDDEKRDQMFAFGTRNPVAYEYYLQGNVLFDKAHTPVGDVHDLAKANSFYEQAIDADPDFAAPWYRHQDVYSHLLTLTSNQDWPDTLTKELAVEQVLYDVNMARAKAKGRAETLFYEMEYAMVSDDWSTVPRLFQELDNNPEYLGPISHFGGGWSRSLFISLERADLGLRIAKLELANDPLSPRAKNSIAVYLTAENQYDSAAYWNNLVQEVTGRGATLGMIIDPGRAEEFVTLESNDRGTMLVKLFAESIKGSNQLPKDFEKELQTPGGQLVGAYIYSFAGNQLKADSIANALDSRFMGSFTISDRIIGLGGKIRFNLSATPNFTARLREGGITDLEAYQTRHWINL